MNTTPDPQPDAGPADQYARFRRSRRHPALADFSSHYDFPLDDFQVRACQALENGHSVLVAAPTGSGKTLVGEFAVHLAISSGRKCFFQSERNDRRQLLSYRM